MNIFATSPDPTLSACTLADRHVVKMVIETAQMLSAAILYHDDSVSGLYRATHVNHPCSVWVRSSQRSFLWTVAHGISLADEYEKRYKKQHKSKAIIELCAKYVSIFPDVDMPKFAMAMPEEYKCDDPHVAYQNYLRSKYTAWGDKARWTSATVPLWIIPEKNLTHAQA